MPEVVTAILKVLLYIIRNFQMIKFHLLPVFVKFDWKLVEDFAAVIDKSKADLRLLPYILVQDEVGRKLCPLKLREQAQFDVRACI